MADRASMLKDINEISFMVNDLTLYLDTHPLDGAALDQFGESLKRRRELLEAYAKEFEPLMMELVCPETNNQTESLTAYPGVKHFTWTDGPLPWEGGSI